MPCRTDYADDSPEKLENNRLTRILCWLVEELPTNTLYDLRERNPEFSTWVRKHEAEDRQRREREAAQKARDQARVRAIQKLTPEELRALVL